MANKPTYGSQRRTKAPAFDPAREIEQLVREILEGLLSAGKTLFLVLVWLVFRLILHLVKRFVSFTKWLLTKVKAQKKEKK